MDIKNFCIKAGAVLLAFLLIFVGISNFFLENNNNEKIIAKVGNETISLNEYKFLYQNYGDKISNDEERKTLKYDLLNELINQKLLFNLLHDLGLEIGEESVKEHIKNAKFFQNDKGEFDKKIFHTKLDMLNITENEYILKIKQSLSALMFKNVIFKDNYPITFGKQIDEQIYNYRYHTRIVDIVKITQDAVDNIPEPNEKDLLDLYEQNKSSFNYPEYRTAQYIAIDPKYFEDRVNISDTEVEKIIDDQVLRDQRDILNLIFSTKEEAEKTKKTVEIGETSFEQISQPKDIRIQNITRDFLPENMREKVFSLKEGEISQVLQSNFGWHLIKIENIHQISDKDLSDLKERIRSALTKQRSFEQSNDFINQANYKIYAGATIEDISNEYGIPIHTIGPVSADGMDQDGNHIEGLNDIISFIFSRKQDSQNYFSNINKFIVNAKIINTIPPKSQSFEESKSSVLQLWHNKFIAKKLDEIGAQVVNQLNSNPNIEEIKGIRFIKAQQIYRNSSNYPAGFIEKVFNMKLVDSVTQPIRYNNEIIIGVLKKMQLSEGKLDALDTGRRIMLSLEEQLINYLRSKYKVEVYHSVLDDLA